jgi:hypothetical protein
VREERAFNGIHAEALKEAGAAGCGQRDVKDVRRERRVD